MIELNHGVEIECSGHISVLFPKDVYILKEEGTFPQGVINLELEISDSKLRSAKGRAAS